MGKGKYGVNFLAEAMANMIIAYAPFVVAFFAALVVPTIFRNPNMFGKLSCVICKYSSKHVDQCE